ncbi:MAG: DOMON-like domain-containing protein [Sphingomicrobium sp.]
MIELVPHLLHPPHAVQSVAVSLKRSEAGLSLAFLLTGDLDAVVIPPPSTPNRADGLWETTCFEAFVRGDGPAYAEYNFSPSGEWAAFAFDDYRLGMRETDAAVSIACRRDSAELAIDVVLDAAFPDHARLAVSAVVEERGGQKSYWALAHRAGPPDFHHETCFALRLADIARE